MPLNLADYLEPVDADAPPAAGPPAPSGTGNWFTAGLGSGFYSALSEAGSGAEAVGRAIGADHFADQAKAFADAQRQTAATYARPDLENASWYDPTAIGYRVTQGLPQLAGMLGAGAAAAAVGPEAGTGILGTAAARQLVGMGLSALPGAIGGNVQRREDYQGYLDQSHALGAIAAGAIEAPIQTILPMKLESSLAGRAGFGMFEKPAESVLGRLGQTVASGAIVQAPVAGATEWLTQAFGDPHRTFASRASDVVQAALTGGLLGGATAGILHPILPTREIAKTPPAAVDTGQLEQVVTQSLQPPAPTIEPPGPGNAVVTPTTLPAPPPAAPPEQPPAAPVAPPPAAPVPPPAAPPEQPPAAPVAPPPAAPAPPPAAPVAPPPAAPAPPPAAPAPPPAAPAPPQPAPAAPVASPLMGGPPTGQPWVKPLSAVKPTAPVTPPPPTVAPPVTFNWNATRTELQKAKAYSTIIKGPFNSRADLVNTVATNTLTRLVNGSTVPSTLQKAAVMFGVLDPKTNEPIGIYAQQAADMAKAKAVPPAVAADPQNAPTLAGPSGAGASVYTPPARIGRGDVPAAHQKRWDALEQVRTKLLGDNLSDFQVQQLLDQTTKLQNGLLNVTRGGDNSWRAIEAKTKALSLQANARTAQAQSPVAAPSVNPNAPAQSPDPSPAAQKTIAEAKPAAAPAPAAPAPMTKEAQAKAAKAAPVRDPVSDPVRMKAVNERYEAEIQQADKYDPITLEKYAAAAVAGPIIKTSLQNDRLLRFAAKTDPKVLADAVEAQRQKIAQERAASQPPPDTPQDDFATRIAAISKILEQREAAAAAAAAAKPAEAPAEASASKVPEPAPAKPAEAAPKPAEPAPKAPEPAPPPATMKEQAVQQAAPDVPVPPPVTKEEIAAQAPNPAFVQAAARQPKNAIEQQIAADAKEKAWREAGSPEELRSGVNSAHRDAIDAFKAEFQAQNGRPPSRLDYNEFRVRAGDEAARRTQTTPMQTPMQTFAQQFVRQSQREGGRTSNIGVTAKRTRQQMAMDAKREAAGTPAPKAPPNIDPNRFAPPPLSPQEEQRIAALPPREQAIERDARYWEWLRTSYPTDVEARAQQAARLDQSTAALVQPKAKAEDVAKALNDRAQAAIQEQAARRMLAPQTAQDRAKAARDAVRAKRQEDENKRGALEDQHTPEVVKPKLAKTVDEVEDVKPPAEIDTTTAQGRAQAKRLQANAAAPPAVDIGTVSGFARDGRRSQADARREALNMGLRARLAIIESGRRPVTPVPEKVTAIIARAREALTKLQQSGAIIPRNEDFANKEPRFRELLAQHAEQLDLAQRAAEIGGLEGLREIPRDYFGTDLFDEMSGHVTPQTEKNLQAHAVAESRLQDAAALARGERPLIRYSQPPTQHDVDLKNIIDQTGDMRAVLSHIRDNGTSIEARLMADKLLKGGAGGTIMMSDKPPISHREGAVIAGAYFAGLDHTHIYDGSLVEQTVLHEATHAATERAIRAKGPAAQEMQALFDRLKALNEGSDLYALTNPSEFVAEAMSNPQFQQALKNSRVNTGSGIGSRIMDAWQAFKNIVFKALGLSNRTRTLFDQVMDTTNRLMGENVREASSNTNMLVQRGGQQFSEASTQAGNYLIRQVQRMLDDAKTSMTRKTLNVALGMETGGHVIWQIAPHIPAAIEFGEAQNHRTVRTDTLAKPLVAAYKMMQHLTPKAREALNRVMQFGILPMDGTKSWADHTHLHDLPQADALKKQHAELQRQLSVVHGADPHGMSTYKYVVDANDVTQLNRSNFLKYDLKAREYPDENWYGFEVDPVREYEANDRWHDNPAMAKAAMEERQAMMLTGMKAKATELEQLINSLKVKQSSDDLLPPTQRMSLDKKVALEEEIKKQIANREAILNLVNDDTLANNRRQQGPYFHLGREGDHFVTAHVRTDNNIPNEAALQAIADRMEAAGLGGHVISQGVSESSIYLRMESETQREIAFDLFRKMAQEPEAYIDPKKPIARGLASEDLSLYRGIGPQYLRQAIEAVQATKPDYPEGATPEMREALDLAHQQQIREQTRALMAMLPDTSITKIYAKRLGVQGFNANMVNSYKASAIANSRGLSNLSLSRELGLASVKMRDQLRGLQQSPNIKGSTLTAVTQGLGEIMLRNKLYQAHVPSTFMDGIRKTVHAFQIGASPAYFLTLMSQIPTLSLPELAKTHGYVSSAAALAKSTNEAYAIMRAVWSGGEGGLKMGRDAVEFGIRRADLEKAGINPNTIDFIMNLAGRGAFNQGAYSETIKGHQVDNAYGHLLHYAGVMGRYSEQFPRILTALAAKNLHEANPGKAGGAGIHEFAYKKIMDSQFNWNSELNARQTTRSGMFGAMSPLINQFMGFQIRMTEKLYRELSTGFGSRAATPEEAAQSRKWLYGHAAAVTMLAGSLGLPMVSVAASVFDKLADFVTGRDDYDVTASYRNFLAQNFGKEMGEAIARGAPRLAGMDFDHLGEGRIVPGSSLIQFATEKRKLEDAEKDWLKSMAGSSMGFIFNVAAGMRDMMNGDWLDGAIKVTPELLKGGAEAYRLSERGFVDKNGAQLPITANAADVMMQALGIDPAKEAEYDEEVKVARGLQTMRQLRSQNITRHLLLATNRGDQNMMQVWQQEAQKFQMDHPGMMSPLQEFGRVLMTHERSAAIARGFGTPIGVQPRDLVGRGMTSFGNLRQGDQ